VFWGGIVSAGEKETQNSIIFEKWDKGHARIAIAMKHFPMRASRRPHEITREMGGLIVKTEKLKPWGPRLFRRKGKERGGRGREGGLSSTNVASGGLIP